LCKIISSSSIVVLFEVFVQELGNMCSFEKEVLPEIPTELQV